MGASGASSPHADAYGKSGWDLKATKRRRAFRRRKENGTIRCLRPLSSRVISRFSMSTSQTRNVRASVILQPVSNSSSVNQCNRHS